MTNDFEIRQQRSRRVNLFIRVALCSFIPVNIAYLENILDSELIVKLRPNRTALSNQTE